MTALCSYCIQRLALDSHGTETKPQKVVSLVSVNSLVPTMKKKMQKSPHAPTSTIGYAFHNFGWPDCYE